MAVSLEIAFFEAMLEFSPYTSADRVLGFFPAKTVTAKLEPRFWPAVLPGGFVVHIEVVALIKAFLLMGIAQ